jgi:ATP-dependent DNA ligase
VVLDGEAVIWNRDRLDFEALQRRMVTSRAALPALVKEFPAAYAAFDVLAVAGQDVRAVPFAGRRQLLEELAREWAAPLALSPPPQTWNWQRRGYGIFPPPGLKGSSSREAHRHMTPHAPG